MNYFKQKSDRLPIVIITFLFLIDVYMYLIAVSGWALYLFLAFSIFTK